MQLCIDIGNTSVKFGLFEGRALMHAGKEKDANFSMISQWVSNYPQIQSAIVSSVRSLETFNFEELSAEIQWVELSTSTNLPITNNYQSKKTLGKDRIALAVAGHSKFPTNNVLVADLGTCMTLDLITDKGVYMGGIISPGIQMRLDAMHRGTGALPQLTADPALDYALLGNTTESCMMSGAVNGVRLELLKYIEAFESEYDNLKIVLTGGDSKRFENQLKKGIFADPNLVLSGLNEILLYNL